jgi:adenylate cyclase
MAFKVLIVDDEPDLELLVRQKFKKQILAGEFEFLFALNGVEALEKLNDDAAVQLIMSDIKMPVMDGLTLLSRISEIDRTLLTIVVSSYSDMENIRSAMNRGAYDFLTKPIDFHDFEATLKKTMKELESITAGLKAREHLTATLKIVTDLSSELQLGPLLQKIMSTITKMLDAERSTLFLNDEKTNQLYTEFGEGLGRTEVRMPNNAGIAGTVFQTGKAIRISDPYNDPRFNPEVDRTTGYHTRSILCVPVVNKQGKTIGVSEVLNKHHGQFTGDDETRLRSFSSQVSIALENAKLFDDVESIKNYKESILESMSSGVLTVDEDNVIVTCNAAARHILRLDGDDHIGMRAEDFFVGPNAWIVEHLRQVGESHSDNVTMDASMTAAGKTISANVTILRLTSTPKKQSGSMIMIDDITSEKRMKSTMSRYMDPSVAEKLLESDRDVLEGQNSKVTILFSDIRSFTALSERLGPQGTVGMLNEFFTVMVDCIKQEGGMLDKFIGDALMAEFGIPLAHPDDEDRAVRAAILMQRELCAFNRNRLLRNEDPIAIRVGINTDFVISGNIGSPKRMDYTVIGDGVNLASRLESACKKYNAGILISESTYRNLRGEYRCREVDRVVVYGKSAPVGIYEILDYHTADSFPQMQPTLTCFSDGLQLYREREWDRAIRSFQSALALNPSDATSAMYVERCAQLKEAPPPEDWGGVWFMQTK